MNPSQESPLEQRLARVPTRGLPADLRARCLRELRGAATPPARSWLAAWMPGRLVVAGFASAWALCGLLYLTQPRPIDIANVHRVPTLLPDREALRLLAQQRAAREELLLPETPPPRPVMDRPRGSRPVTRTNDFA